MNLLLFDYNKAFLQVYDTFEEILKTNIISENVRPLDIANLIEHLNESFREFYLQNVYNNYTEFLIAYLAMIYNQSSKLPFKIYQIRARPNKQILIKVCSDFILNWQKQIKKCCDLQIFLYIIHNNKDSKKLFEIYYYIRKTLFSYQTQLYRNNPLDKLQYDFEEANRLFRQLFSAELCKGICQRFVALIQKHQKTIYKGNVMKGSFIAEFVLHEYLEIKEKQPDLLKEVIIHNRLLVKEQNKFEFRKRFKINDSIIDYSPQQTGRNQGNKKFILDLSMLDHKKLGVEGIVQSQTNQASQKCLPQDCEHLQQIDILVQREATLVQENGDLKQTNQKIKNQLIESAVEIDSMKRNFDQMRVLTLSMIQNSQLCGDASQIKESQNTQEQANNISKQFEQVYLTVSQKIQDHITAKVSQKKQYRQLTLNNSNFGKDDSQNLSNKPNTERTDQQQIHKNINKQVNQQLPQAVKQNPNSLLKLNQISSEESFIKIKQTESTLTDNNIFKQQMEESHVIKGGLNKDQSLNQIKESQREKSNESKLYVSDQRSINQYDNSQKEDNSDDLHSKLSAYSIHINGQSVREQNQLVGESNSHPQIINAPHVENQKQGNETIHNKNDRQTIASKNQSISNQSSIEDIYILQVEDSVINKPHTYDTKESPIRQISLFQSKENSAQQNLQGVQVHTKGRQEQTEKHDMKKVNPVNIIDQHLNEIIIDNSAVLTAIQDDNKSNNTISKYTIRGDDSGSQNQKYKVSQQKSDQTQQDKYSSIQTQSITQQVNNTQKDQNQPNEKNKQKQFDFGSSQVSANSIGREDQILNYQNTRSTSQPISNNNPPNQPYNSQKNKRDSQLSRQSITQDKFLVDCVIENQQANRSSLNSGRTQNSNSERQSLDDQLQNDSNGLISVERQKFPTFDEGNKMSNSNMAKSGGSNNRNYSPSFNQDLYTLQQYDETNELNQDQQSQQHDSRLKQNSINDFRQKQNSLTDSKQIENNIDYSKQKKSSIAETKVNQSINEEQRQKQNSQASSRQNSNSIVDSKQKQGNSNNDSSHYANSIQNEYRNRGSGIVQQNQEFSQANTNSTSQLSQLKSKGSMSGNLIESINLPNSNYQQQQYNEKYSQQQQNQAEVSKNSNNINTNSKRMGSIEGDIKPLEFVANSQQPQQRGSIQLQNQQKIQQPYQKPQQSSFHQTNQTEHNLNQQEIFDQSTINDSNKFDNLNKRSTFDIPEEEEIADENSDSNPFHSNNESEFSKQRIDSNKQQQFSSSSQQQQKNQPKYQSQQQQQSQTVYQSQQNKYVESIQIQMNNKSNNSLQRLDSMNSTQSNHERTPDNQNKKREFLSSSQKGGMNSSHSPFRKSMYASYQQHFTSGLKPSNNFQINSNQLLQYSATSNQTNFKPNISSFENGEDAHLDHEENQNNISSYNPYFNPSQQQTQINQVRNSLQIQKGGDLNQSNFNLSRNSISNSQHNRSILTQKNEIVQSGFDTSQLSDNRSRNSQIYNIQDSVNDFNNSKYNPRDMSQNQKFANVLQDIDSPMIVNSNQRSNSSNINSSYQPNNDFEGAFNKHAQFQQQRWQQQQQMSKIENTKDNQSEPDEVERQSDTWLRDSVIENEIYLNNEIKRDSKTKQTFGPFKLNMDSTSQDLSQQNPKPIFYGVPIAFQQTELVRKI